MDLDPTNPASVFEVIAVSNEAPNRLIGFRPTSTGRVYRLLYATNLRHGGRLVTLDKGLLTLAHAGSPCLKALEMVGA